MNYIMKLVTLLILGIGFSRAMECNKNDLDEKEENYRTAIESIEYFLYGSIEIGVTSNNQECVVYTNENKSHILINRSFYDALLNDAYQYTVEGLKQLINESEIIIRERSLYFAYYAQMIRLREFLETRYISEESYATALKVIRELQRKKGEAFFLNNFGDTNIVHITSNLIKYANNRVNYIQAFTAHDVSNFDLCLEIPLHFKFVPLREYLEILKKHLAQEGLL